MSRLGIWGPGTPLREFSDFIQAVEKRYLITYLLFTGQSGDIGKTCNQGLEHGCGHELRAILKTEDTVLSLNGLTKAGE